MLCALETRMVIPVGSFTPRAFHARLIFATNRNLEEECSLGRFKTDFLERISTLELFLPPCVNARKISQSWSDTSSKPSTGRRVNSTPIPKKVWTFCSAMTGPAMYVSSTMRSVREPYSPNTIERRSALRPYRKKSIVVYAPSKKRMMGLRFYSNLDEWNDVLWRAWEAYYQECLRNTGGHVGNAIKKAGLRPSSVYAKNKQLEQYKELRDKERGFDLVLRRRLPKYRKVVEDLSERGSFNQWAPYQHPLGPSWHITHLDGS